MNHLRIEFTEIKFKKFQDETSSSFKLSKYFSISNSHQVLYLSTIAIHMKEFTSGVATLTKGLQDIISTSC